MSSSVDVFPSLDRAHKFGYMISWMITEGRRVQREVSAELDRLSPDAAPGSGIGGAMLRPADQPELPDHAPEQQVDASNG